MKTRFPLLLSLAALAGCGGATAQATSDTPPPAGESAAAPAKTSASNESSPKPPASAGASRPETASSEGQAKAPAAAVSGAASDTPILTGLSSEEVFAAVDKNGALFNGCYTIGAGKNKVFKAVVKVKATIGPTGVVNAAEVLTSSAKNAKVDGCVLEAFKKIKFPPPHGGGTAVITFPLSFDGVQQVQ